MKFDRGRATTVQKKSPETLSNFSSGPCPQRPAIAGVSSSAPLRRLHHKQRTRELQDAEGGGPGSSAAWDAVRALLGWVSLATRNAPLRKERRRPRLSRPWLSIPCLAPGSSAAIWCVDFAASFLEASRSRAEPPLGGGGGRLRGGKGGSTLYGRGSEPFGCRGELTRALGSQRRTG